MSFLLALAAIAGVTSVTGPLVGPAASPLVAADSHGLAAGSRPAIGALPLTGEVVPGLKAALARGTVRPAPTGSAAPASPVTVTVTLRRSDEAGFQRFLAGVQDPRSPSYRRFLTQAQLTGRYGPSAAAYAGVVGWLRASGLRPVAGSANRLTVTVTGARRQVERAFGVRLRDYLVGGRRVYANAGDPLLPSRLVPQVQSIDGLSDIGLPSRAPTIAALFKALCGVTGAAASLAYADKAGQDKAGNDAYLKCLAEHGVKPAPQLGAPPPAGVGVGAQASSPVRSVASPTIDGSGQRIGLLEFDTFHLADVRDYAALVGVDPAAIGNVSQVPVAGGVATPGAGEGEVLLDVDVPLTVVPRAQIVVYDAPPTTSYEALFNAMISDRDTVISNSWSSCEDQVPPATAASIDSVLAQAAASGVSVVNGSGDAGTTCLDGSPNTVGVPADSPNATAVGATTLNLGPASTYGSERWWDGSATTPLTGQGGFGVSRLFARPPYQQPYTGAGGRSVPDVAVNGDPATGYFICQADAGGCPTPQTFGGTSAAAPLMAGLAAALNQEQGSNLGALNPRFYPLGTTTAFHSPASMGSDFAHLGLGSPNLARLGLALRGATAGPVTAASSTVADTAVTGTPADGATADTVVAFLRDAAGNPVSGRQVALAAASGSHAIVSPATGTSSVNNGAVIFSVTDTVPESVTVTATDTTDGVVLDAHPTLAFVPPAATDAQITGSPATVANDGTTPATITVYLQNRLGRPAVGKTVSLSAAGSRTAISPASGQAVTDSLGNATFTARDTATETVAFTAIDVTDGSLQVPGSATVTFEPPGSSPCPDAVPAPVSPLLISRWATGLPYNPENLVTTVGRLTFTLGRCATPTLAFDAAGRAYVGDFVNGAIYTFGATGGAAGPGSALPNTTLAPGGQLGGLAFGRNGEFFAALTNTAGDFGQPRLVRLDPASGAIERTIVTVGGGMAFCPWNIAVDPLSGDVFASDLCTGFLASNNITRISNPDGAAPSGGAYVNLGGRPEGLAFAPDGTLYVALVDRSQVVAVSGTDGPASPTVRTVATLPSPVPAVAVGATDGAGHATSLLATDVTGDVIKLDLSTSPATQTTIASGGAGLGTFGNVARGPDGCLYIPQIDQILKLNGACSGTPPPELTLDETTGSATPATGSFVTLTARLANASLPAGTPVVFTVTGPNQQRGLGHLDAAGQASFRYQGVLTGIDRVVARVLVGAGPVDSVPVRVHWLPGQDVTFLSLNGSQESGPLGQPARFSVQLTDVSQSPAVPMPGAGVSVTVAGQSCNAVTDATGGASCALTPPGPMGLEAVTASYAGDAGHTPSTASGVFAPGGLGLAPGGADLSLKMSSSPNPVIAGQRLTYTLTAANAGPDAAVGAKIVDTLPGGTTFAGASSGCTNSAGTVTCQLGNMSSGSSATRQIVVLVATGAAGPLVNTATVSSATADPTAADNRASSSTAVTAACSASTAGTVSGSITVPAGRFLCLTNATVNGTVLVESGGGLRATDSQLLGAVISGGARFVTLCGSRLTGPVKIDATGLMVRVGDDDGDCAPNHLGGSLTVTNNLAGLEVFGNTIAGAMEASGNRGTSPPGADAAPEIEQNTIGGSLSCSTNAPPPNNDGRLNSVSGARTGQCTNL